MKAVMKVKDGKDGWEIREADRIEPKDDEVEIEIMAAGICGSELHLYHDNHFYTPPVIVGHEFSGRISKTGKNVTKWKIGDRVVSENHKTACWSCSYCRSGQLMFCKNRRSVGYVENGGWTSYICMPEKLLIGIPDNVTYEEASMTEPVSIATQALCIREPIRAGEIVLVQGCGTIGLINAMVAKAAGAGTVIITGTKEDRAIRLPIAKKLGIDYVFDVTEVDLKEKIMALTGDRGVDMIVEASGSEIAINQAVDLVKKTGRIVAIGEAANPKFPFRWNDAIFRACSITFSLGAGYHAWNLALELMAQKKIELKPLITHEISMKDFRKGFEMLEEKVAVKVVMKPDSFE